MQIATQEVWNPGYGYGVALTTTSPATGSEYMVGGSYLGRKELDPFGTDVTEPPTPGLISEPVFYDAKFADMLIEIEGGPTAEYEQANADWDSLVTETIRTAQERDRAERLWQSGRRSEAMAILHNNPNVGVEYRSLVNGQVVSSGSYFGKAAADFLNGLSMAVDAGLLSPITEQSGATRHHPQNPQPDANAIRAGLKNALSKVDCSAIVNNLLNSVATKKNPRVPQFSPLAMLDSLVIGSGGLTRVRPPGCVGGACPTGSLKKGNARIFLEARSFGAEDQLKADIQGALGELMHLGGQNAHYTDRDFAEIVHRDFYTLTTSIWPSDPKDTYHKAAMKNPNNISWSYYWHQAVDRLCFSGGTE